jgi:hypothetical protein
MEKEWKIFAKKNILEKLYDKNRDQRITDFLENYGFLKVEVLNDSDYEFRMEVLFKRENEILKIIAQFNPLFKRFHWDIPDKFDIEELLDILDKFNFERYIE